MNATDIESLCAGWPGVASSIKWEDDLVLTVAGKMFAVFCLRGPHRQRLSFKVDPERFLELTDQPGITSAAYMARAFWVSIAEPDRFARAKMSEFIRHSYDLVRSGLSKKQQVTLAEKDSAADPIIAATPAEKTAEAKLDTATPVTAKAAAAKPAMTKPVATKPAATKSSTTRPAKVVTTKTASPKAAKAAKSRKA